MQFEIKNQFAYLTKILPIAKNHFDTFGISQLILRTNDEFYKNNSRIFLIKNISNEIHLRRHAAV